MKMRKSIQQGFTLIELMIVVAIIGILAAIALPAYQDYMIRSKMTEVLGLAAAAKTTITEFRQATGLWPENADEAGVNANAAQSQYLSAGVTISTNGGQGIGSTLDINYTVSATAIGATATEFGSGGGGTETYVLQGSVTAVGAGIQWTCKTDDTGGTIAKKYLPANCR